LNLNHHALDGAGCIIHSIIFDLKQGSEQYSNDLVLTALEHLLDQIISPTFSGSFVRLCLIPKGEMHAEATMRTNNVASGIHVVKISCLLSVAIHNSFQQVSAANEVIWDRGKQL
jgi:hypothetical protein